MLAVNLFVKSAPRRGDGRSPVAMPPGPATPGAAAGPTSPTGSAARRGRLHVQTPQPAFEAQTRERKAAAARAHEDEYSGGSSDDESDGSPVERPRRRFVKPTVTTFETCFSRQAIGGGGGSSGGGGGRRFNRRPGAGPRVGLASYSFINSNSSAALALVPAAESADSHAVVNATPLGAAHVPGIRRAPAVSSLSSVLQELMHGRQRALSSYVDATAPQRNPRTFVVQQDPEGSLFVASSIGKVFLQPAPEQTNSSSSSLLLSPAVAKPSSAAAAAAASSEAHAVPPPDFAGSMRRSDLDFSRVQRKSAALRRSLSRRDSIEAVSSGSGRGSRNSLASSKVKLLGFSNLKSKLAARHSSLSHSRNGGDRPMTLDEIEDERVPVVLSGSSDSVNMALRANGDSETAVPMLDPDLVDARARGDSGWEVPAVLPQPSASSSALPAVDKSKIVNRSIPFVFDDDDDEDDNLLNRSFLNVRDIEFHPRTDKDDAPVSVSAAVLENECGDDDGEDEDERPEQRSLHDRATFDGAANRPSATTSLDAYANRGSSLSVTAGGRTSVSEFLGGYKGQLSSRRSSSGQDGGFVNRARSVRHGARRSTAANSAATALTRKLREARNRIPFEFRDDLVPLGKAKKSGSKKSKKLRVRWDLTPYVREFEVESEDEAEAEAAAQAQIVKAPWEYRDSEERDSDDDDDDDNDEQW